MAEENRTADPEKSWEIDFFRPEDAPGVVKLFELVYGLEYPVKTFLDPERLIEENRQGRTISSVARTPSGEILGHSAIFRSAPYEGIYELGAGVVSPSCRKSSIGTQVVSHAPVAAQKYDLDGLFGEAVCNHTHMQKVSEALGWVPCAFEVDLMPAAAYAKEKSAEGRVATMLAFTFFKLKPQRVYVPEVYAEFARFIYGGMEHRLEFEAASAPLPADRASRITTEIFDFAQVTRFAINEAGADISAALDREEAAARGAVVQQVWLKLSWPWAGALVDILRARGYFIGGVLPRWFDVDGLLMQKINGTPNWEGIQIYSNRVRQILEMVKADRAAVQG